MEKMKLSEMLDKVYELEGLIGLAMSRGDAPSRLFEMIVDKTRGLQEYVDGIGSPDMDHSVPAEEDITEEKETEAAPGLSPASGSEKVSVTESVSDDYYIVEDDETEPLAVPSAPSPQPLAAASPVPPIPRPTGRLVFSINDRYRYRRELFAGNDADFNTALAKVASMESYDEAEEFFIDELQWNPERPEVVDFMAVIRNYFEA